MSEENTTILPHEAITPIPATKPKATPSLWNTRFQQITENFQTLKNYAKNAVLFTTATGAAKLPVGDISQRGDPDAGLVRFNSETSEFEGGDGDAWGSLGGGMPRFTPYIWGGRANAMPQGDTQSSGQQLLDLMYPTMRADVLASQFTCTEAEWQADAYKRVTHWSLGVDGSWMRPPDKNGVQPGNVGAFYGVGSNPAGALTGTAVTDAGRELEGTFYSNLNPGDSIASTGAFYLAGANAGTSTHAGGTEIADLIGFKASRVWPVANNFRPCTWYGIWMIRMYGRVLNPGALNAPALNARMDLLDARVATLEGRRKSLGDGQTYKARNFVFNTYYTNTGNQNILVGAAATTHPILANYELTIAVRSGANYRYYQVNSYSQSTPIRCTGEVFPGEEFSILGSVVSLSPSLTSWEIS